MKQRIICPIIPTELMLTSAKRFMDAHPAPQNDIAAKDQWFKSLYKEFVGQAPEVQLEGDTVQALSWHTGFAPAAVAKSIHIPQLLDLVMDIVEGRIKKM